ncbi:MAG: DUF368 domain-containing protein [Defluviitaleaceae bacterium]|nr:DUF368 domain-containing protein [Defluviitaleaceae bacterium]
MKYILLTLQGVAVGAANIVPGISGATVAVIFRVYDRLLEAVNQLFSKEWRKSFKMLIPFGLGALVGIMALGSSIDFFIQRAPLQTTAFLAGLMFGTIPFLHRLATQDSVRKPAFYVAAGVAAVAIILMGLFSPAQPAYRDAANAPLIFFFLSGFFAAAVMIVPGVSGSMVLIMLGLFPAVIHTINLAREFIMSPSGSLLTPILRVALPMVGGVLLGVVLMSKLITALLKRYFNLMYFIILGLVIGTIFILFLDPEIRQNLTSFVIITGTLTFGVGAVLAYVMGKKSKIPDILCEEAAPSEG